jgi:hypothetical protein
MSAAGERGLCIVLHSQHGRLLTDYISSIVGASSRASGFPVPRITRHLRLPAFRYAPLDPYTWPPARR